MTTTTDELTGRTQSLGAFVTGLLGAVASAALLVAWPLGFPFSMRTMTPVLYVYIPTMIVSFMLAGTAMGWLFISFGRTHRFPRWPRVTAGLIVLTVLELFALTYVASLYQAPIPR